MYVFAVYASHVHLNNLWTNMCCVDLHLARAFGTVGPCMCNEVWKVGGGQSICTTLKEFRWYAWAWFRTAQNARIFKKTTCYICSARRCCSLLYSSFLMWTSRHCGCIYTLCLLFRFCARLLTLPCSHHNFCHFCRCNNETASAATALRTINFPKCTQHFVSKVF